MEAMGKDKETLLTADTRLCGVVFEQLQFSDIGSDALQDSEQDIHVRRGPNCRAAPTEPLRLNHS